MQSHWDIFGFIYQIQAILKIRTQWDVKLLKADRSRVLLISWDSLITFKPICVSRAGQILLGLALLQSPILGNIAENGSMYKIKSSYGKYFVSTGEHKIKFRNTFG